MSLNPHGPPYRDAQSLLEEYDPHESSTSPRSFRHPNQPFPSFGPPPSLAVPPLRQPSQPYIPRDYGSYSMTPSRPVSYAPRPLDYPERQPFGPAPMRAWGRSAPQPYARPQAHAQPYPAQPYERPLDQQKGERDRARGGRAARKQRTLTKQRDEASAQVEALQRRVAELETELEKERELRREAEKAMQEMEEEAEEGEEEEEEEEEEKPQAVQTEEEREWAAGQEIFAVLQQVGRSSRGLARVVAAHEAAMSQG